MANTYTLIASNTLGSSAASVTFSSIPATYTDLVLKLSVRSDVASNDKDIRIQFNSDTATNYSVTYLTSNAGTPSSGRLSSSAYTVASSGIQGTTTTSSTFSSLEIYIPSYLVSQNKPLSISSATENNATGNFITANANLWRNTAAITSIYLYQDGNNFVSGSSFFLYGIKNS